MLSARFSTEMCQIRPRAVPAAACVEIQRNRRERSLMTMAHARVARCQRGGVRITRVKNKNIRSRFTSLRHLAPGIALFLYYLKFFSMSMARNSSEQHEQLNCRRLSVRRRHLRICASLFNYYTAKCFANCTIAFARFKSLTFHAHICIILSFAYIYIYKKREYHIILKF